jgi:hypothetical protein
VISEALLGGMKEGGEKSINMSKSTEVHQGPDESPSQFYEQLCEAFHPHTPFDPEVAENQRMINAVFVSLAQGDIRQKLQKLEGFAGMNISQLLEVATKVCQLRPDQMGGRWKDEKEGGPPCCSSSQTGGWALACRPWQRKRQSPWSEVNIPGTASP